MGIKLNGRLSYSQHILLLPFEKKNMFHTISRLNNTDTVVGIISVNMSLVPVLGLALDLVHVHLSEMPVYSPIFYICDNTYTLSLLLHDADYYHQVHNKLFHFGMLQNILLKSESNVCL